MDRGRNGGAAGSVMGEWSARIWRDVQGFWRKMAALDFGRAATAGSNPDRSITRNGALPAQERMRRLLWSIFAWMVSNRKADAYMSTEPYHFDRMFRTWH